MGLFGKNSKAEEAAKKEQQEIQELLAMVECTEPCRIN